MMKCIYNLSLKVLQLSSSYHNLAELNVQNLAIHQTLMNESAGVTMKEEILQNYMNIAQNEGNHGNDEYLTDFE